MDEHILAQDPKALTETLINSGEKRYRAAQILNWIYRRRVIDFRDMTNLPENLRATLSGLYRHNLPEILQEDRSEDGTKKFLLKLADDAEIEMVLIPASEKNTLCLSTQVGCKRQCRFCATAGLGFTRDLTAAEILSQVFLAKQLLAEAKLTNIVFMGMGEPLDNVEQVIKALQNLQSDDLFSFSPRRITISTCGIIPGINRLATTGMKFKLAVSLNAAIQEKREQLMPIAVKYPLDQLKSALLEFRQHNPYRITFEYIMIKDFNIGKEDLLALKRFLGDISCKLNLISWNPVAGLPYETPSQNEVDKFMESLQSLSVTLTYRKSRGADIQAACGQLAAGHKDIREGKIC